MRVITANERTGTKQKILEASIELFSLHGYSAVSVREITKLVGIKESALYNHFKTKDEILETIYSIFQFEISSKALPPIDRLEELLQDNNVESFLLQGFHRFKQSVDDANTVKIWRILNIEQFRDVRARKLIVEDVYQKTIDFLEAAFTIMISKGMMKQGEPRLLATQYQYPLFAFMTEYLLLSCDQIDTKPLEHRVEQHIRYFIAAVKVN